MCSLRDAAKDFEALGVKVYGVSTDDVVSLARFVKEQELNFPLLSDPDGSAAAKYDAAAAGKGFASRITFVLDPEGVLRHVDRSVKVATHGADLVAEVRRLQGG